jgi:hypothetical protein
MVAPADRGMPAALIGPFGAATVHSEASSGYILAALIDALTSPERYLIVERGGELFTEPVPAPPDLGLVMPRDPAFLPRVED